MDETVVMEVSVPEDPLDKEERDFISRGIHNFSFRKQEYFDEQKSKDIRAQIMLGLTAQQSTHLFPGSMVESAIDSSTSPLGEKKTYWLKRLIKKTSGDTQKLLEGLLYINGLLQKCGAKRASTKKKVDIKPEIQEVHEQQPSLEIKMETPLPEVITPAFFENAVEEKAPQEPEKAPQEPSSEEEVEERQPKKHKKKKKSKMHKKRVKYVPSSDSSSSSSDDDSEDDFHYYYKRLKKPYKTYKHKQRSKVSRPFSTYVPRRDKSPVYAPQIPIEVPQQQSAFQPFKTPAIDYASHFLGNGLR